jgi:hypothetical protein
MADEKQGLSYAILKQDAAGGGAAGGGVIEALAARDRRRVRLLTALTVLLWLAAVLLVVTMIVMYNLFVIPKLKHEAQDAGQRVWSLISYVIGGGAALIGVAVIILAMATMTSLMLLFTSRRATLRQVQTGLAEVSEQLRQIRAEMKR